MRPSVRILCLPDVDKAIGGVKQLYRHAEHLVDIGWDVAIVTESQGFRPSWFHSDAPSLSFEECIKSEEFSPEKTILLLPETYLNVNLFSFRGFDLSAFARVVFNQNAYYTYGQGGEDLFRRIKMFYHQSSTLQVLSVSEDTHNFLSHNLGICDSRLSRIVNAIEPIFQSHKTSHNYMHWMPRKNPLEVQSILLGIQGAGLFHSQGWTGEALQGLSHADVADKLNRARIFLSFGHPEGFGLPIAEAMSSGCWVVGYSGGGGRELFRFGASEEVTFGDWTAFVQAIQRAFTAFADRPRETELRLHRQALAVRSLFGRSQERATVEIAWQRIEKIFSLWLNNATSSKVNP